MFYEELDVIIPTYNRASYLKIALESLCESIATWRKTIILNNASTDNTLEIIEDICKKYPKRNIEVITNEYNIGNPANFKKTQTLATNKYVAIFHDDDAIHPEYIDRAMQLFIENEKNVVMVSGGASALYNVNHENWSICPDSYWYYPANKNVFLQLLIGRPIFCNCIYKTNIYKSIEYKPEKFGKLHDIIFMAELCEQGDFIFIHGECVRWRQHAKSDSNTLKTGPFPQEIINILKKMKDIFYLENKDIHPFIVNKIYNILFITLLYNFSLFLYQWSDLKRFLTWEDFKQEMIKKGVFKRENYFIFNRIIDVILNPWIRKMAERYRKKCSKSYLYRVGAS